MTDIICNWLEREVKLSRKVGASNFAWEFSTGYLIGEVLYKYGLQEDFDQFSQSRTSESRLNNFTRIEPVLHLLEIPYDTNIAREIMTESHGMATRLMYQLYIAIKKKEKNNLTGTAMETMRPSAPVKLEAVESLMYKERLKHMTPRQTDLNLESLVQRFHKHQIAMESTAFRERFLEQENQERIVQEKRQGLLEKYQENHARKSEMLAKIKAATVHIPKPPSDKTAAAIAERRAQRRKHESQMVKREIDAIEERLNRTLPASKAPGEEDTGPASEEGGYLNFDPLDLIKPASNDEYINHIRKRLNEDASARDEREKRRRKVLVDQLKAHEAQENARREEVLVGRLMRQSQQERRIAVQLLQARHEKEVIRNNRLSREQEYEARRLRELEEALNKEAEMARLHKIEYLEQTKKDEELHEQIMAEKAEARYRKHYDMCAEVLSDMVDFTTKVAEYRELTNKLVPAKLMRDWTSLFVSGQLLYELGVEPVEEDSEPTPEQILEEERLRLLDEADFTEYTSMTGEWQMPDGGDQKGPPRTNPIVGHIVQRLFNMVHPPSPPPSPPQFPPFPIKACVVGKTFSGKTTVCKKLAEYHRIHTLNVEQLIQEAIDAYKRGEVLEPEEDEEPEVKADEERDGEEKPPGTTESAHKPATLSSEPEVVKTQESSPPAETPVTTPAAPPEEGMEKTDPEKPVVEKEASSASLKASASRDSNRSSKHSIKPEASPRAKLGHKAMKLLKKGKGVEDNLAVEILVEVIRRLPEGTGWVLDNFPATYSQAKLLEKALCGVDPAGPDISKTGLSAKPKRSSLAPDPRPGPPPSEPTSGINVIIYFDIKDELCLKRSAGRTYASQSNENFHEEFKPPPEGSITGVGSVEKVVPVDDPDNDQQQIQHRITSFQESWPKVEKWFNKFGTLRTVDANQDFETIFLDVERILEETLNKLMKKDEPTPEPVEVVEEKPPEPPVEPPKPVEVPPEPTPPSAERSRPPSKKGSRTGSRSGSAEKKSKKSPSPSKSSKEGKGTPKSGRKSAKKQKTPEPEPEPEPEAPPGTPPPQPGSEQWEFVDQPIDQNLAEILAPNWEAVETSYITNSKATFRQIRDERDAIIKYFYTIRKEYMDYLRRPDHKQEFVSQWQTEFNDIPDHLRHDEDMHAELHQRVDDLRERLWSICDERKEQAEKEREMIQTDCWVDDHMGMLCNHYITMMQAEVDRYQDTLRLLKDYYRGMEGKIPDELSTDFIRIPLIELPATEVPASPTKSGTVSQASSRTTSNPTSPAPQDSSATDVKAVTSKPRTPSAKRSKRSVQETGSEEVTTADTTASGEEVRKPKIPLVPRRPVSPDPSAAGGSKAKAEKAKSKKESSEELPPPPTDPDDKLVYDAFLAGVTAIDKMHAIALWQELDSEETELAAEQAAKEAEEEAENEREKEREAEKLKAAAADAKKKGGKKGDKGGKKSRSPSPKKGKTGAPNPQKPTPEQKELNPEDEEKKKQKERARQEFLFAIQEEAHSSKTRMELIRSVTMLVLQDLRDKAEASYKDMDDWLGARFLKEMASIDHLSEVARSAIESNCRLREELVIDQEEFCVSQDVKVLRSPSPVSRPAPEEQLMAEAFTVNQVKDIYNQFQMIAPSGMLALKTFQEILHDLSSLTHGTEEIPDIWRNIPTDKLEQMGSQLSSDGEYLDWRAFLLQASQPWPRPTQANLLQTLDNFKDMDQQSLGYITREQYERMELWFTGETHPPPSATDPQEPLPYDRLGNLKEAFFDMFADHSEEPAKLHYTTMLLYFSVASEPVEGFLRALSVAAGTHMPRLPLLSAFKKSSRSPSQASLTISVEADGEKGAVDEQEEIPESALQATVSLDALVMVLHHGQSMRGDSHRFSVTADPEDTFSKERLAGVYGDLGSEDCQPVRLSVLLEHPVIQDILTSFDTYKTVDLRAMLTSPPGDYLELQSTKTDA